MGRKTHITDFIQEKGAPVCLLELADALLGGTGKTPLFMTEELTFNKLRRNGSAVHFHHSPGSTLAPLVDPLGYEFLARSCLARNQHTRLGWSHTLNGLLDGTNGRTFSQNRG